MNANPFEFEAVNASKRKTETAKPHPKRVIVTALRKFMAARDSKIEKQSKVGNHLAQFERARQLALRLEDPNQLPVYIGELNKEAVAHAHLHHAKLKECKAFWYGPEGLKWLAYKRGMETGEWSAYQEFMDEAALKALWALSCPDLPEDRADPFASANDAHMVGESIRRSPAEILALLKSRQLARPQGAH